MVQQEAIVHNTGHYMDDMGLEVPMSHPVLDDGLDVTAFRKFDTLVQRILEHIGGGVLR